MSSDLKKLNLGQLRHRCNEPDDNSCPKTVEDRNHIFAAALDVEDLDDWERAFLAVAQRVYREGKTTDTPIEFFLQQQMESLRYRAPTLEDVRTDFEELKLNWRDAVQIARRFYAEHRELVTQEAESEPEEEDSDADDADEAFGAHAG